MTHKKTHCIVKVPCHPQCHHKTCTQCKFLKYIVTNQLSFTRFLDRQYPQWRWYNVYHYDRSQADRRGRQIASFTRHRRAHHAWVVE